MTVTVSKKIQDPFSTDLIRGGIDKSLSEKGRLPPVSVRVTPIDKAREPFYLDGFLEYSFDSSMLIPVDSFSFKFANPDEGPFYETVKEGDMVTLYANDVPISSGIIDTIEIDTETESGEMISVSGRDLLSQFEDQDAIGPDDKPIYGKNLSPQGVFEALANNTRLKSKSLELRGISQKPQLFATSPGESKLTSLQRYMESLNCLAWMSPNGNLIIGKPTFNQAAKGVFYVTKSNRDSNCSSMKVIYASTNIPNSIVGIWSGQENVTDRLPNQRYYNAAYGPTRLRTSGHIVNKSVVTSVPTGASPQELSDVNFLKNNSNVLQASALREMARANKQEVIVQVVVPSHYNVLGEPYVPDTVYRINYERGSINEDMYLFQVQYSLSEGSGQKTNLFFCRKFSIVAGTKI